MAFPSAFKSLHSQNQLVSSNFCKCLSTFCPTSNNFSYGFPFPISSPKNHSKLSPVLQVEANSRLHSETEAPVTEKKRSKPSSGRRILDKRRDKDSENKFGSKKRRDSGSEYSFIRPGDEDSAKTTPDVKMDRAIAIKGENSRKYILYSPLTFCLDMCSKRGDVMGAIAIYDFVKREGMMLGQYHYAVLLYLCSSAATGVVQPAKSGNGNRSYSKAGSFNDDSTKMNTGSETGFQTLDGLIHWINGDDNTNSVVRSGIGVGEDFKEYALKRGFEIFEEMISHKVPMNEATFTCVARMAMSMGDGEMAFNMVKQMKDMGINPKLRSYGRALAVFCNSGDVEKAFEVEEHMLANGVYPEEPELAALLKVSIETSSSNKVYYSLHKLRTSVRKVLPSTADVIETWFKSTTASRVGKRKWDQDLIKKAVEDRGGGWHGQGWLGKGKWTVTRSFVGQEGLCKCCGEKLVTIDLDPMETENFAESVARIARQREKGSSFETFQKWLDDYGPFEAVVDAANVGLFSSRRFAPSKVNAIAYGVRKMLTLKKWPLIVLHNRRMYEKHMHKGLNKILIENWKKNDALYATPTGSNDDWYWLYAAIKFKCLIVTNDKMRDHLFRVLGNDFFPKWKERHQVRFNFSGTDPVFHMPPSCSVVIQESEKGHWHVPIESDQVYEEDKMWLCITRDQ